eukprot:gnl/Dysnectes_brevis/3501_a4444_666.p1 GENE.gnl/Dysnectes_brevis/3501_a4444_666~~gnl/Dysnectes_brevis/3501_a4444_666.p1  ORF type:complete len:883 (+),score=130.95 gnl/Dysnectes_brevis/3501_a4444_666:388-2649(+)
MEPNAWSLVVPTAIGMLFTYIVIQFYRQFHILYVLFRQKTLKRTAPQNYTVLLETLPPHINTRRQLLDVLHKAYRGEAIKKVLVVPPNTTKLTLSYWKLRYWIKKFQKQSRFIQRIENKIAAHPVRLMMWIHTTRLSLVLSKHRKLGQKIERNRHTVVVAARAGGDILTELDGVSLPPELPEAVTVFQTVFSLPPDIDVPTPLALSPPAHPGDAQGVGPEGLPPALPPRNTLDLQLPAHTSAFVIFETQGDATQAAQSLLFMNEREPNVRLAPSPPRVMWGNLQHSRGLKSVLNALFVLLVIALFVGYAIPQSVLMSMASKYQTEIFQVIYSILIAPRVVSDQPCPDAEETGLLPNMELGLDNFDGSWYCFACYEVASLGITYIPTIISAIFMSILPYIIMGLTFMVLPTSKTAKRNLEYNCLFYFLIFIQGVLQILLSSAQTATGYIDLSILLELNFNQIIDAIGRGIPDKTFTFLNYVVTKYILFPILSLLRLPDVATCAFKYMTTWDPLLRSRIHLYKSFPYTTQLAYMTHMCVISLLYAIVSPIVLPIVAITLLLMCAVDRFNILYVYRPTPETDMSAEEDIIKGVAENTFIGLLAMVLGSFAVFLVIGYHAKILSFAFATAFFICVFWKMRVDSQFQRSMSFLHLAPDRKGKLKLNPYIPPTPELEHMAKNGDVRAQKILDRIDLTDLPCSFVKPTSELFLDDAFCELANPESIGQKPLTDTDVKNIAAAYTHPAIRLSYLQDPSTTL